MGFFSNFFIKGFTESQQQFYSPGALYEVLSKINENLKGEEMRRKVKTLLGGWFVPADSFREQGQKVPAYALEMHSINEKNNPFNGYGTFVFVPDERQKMVILPLTSNFSKPVEVYDEEDPLKVLAAKYADETGMSKNKSLAIYELSCSSDEFYPFELWNRDTANDPLEEIFGVFDSLESGEFAGISIVVVPPEKDWDQKAKMRIRNIEDPNYEEEIGLIETVRRFTQGQEMPEEEAQRLAGYVKQQLDPSEKAEIAAITNKINTSVFRCSVRVYASNKDIADELAGIIMQRTSGKYNSLVVANRNANLRDIAMRKESSYSFLMSDDEIASIWHVPADNTMGEKKHKPMAASLKPPESLITINVGDPGDIQKLLLSIK